MVKRVVRGSERLIGGSRCQLEGQGGPINDQSGQSEVGEASFRV